MELTIRELRRVKEISQEEMANACGVHMNTYRAWEENPKDIRLGAAKIIASKLGISLDDIFLPPDTTELNN
jgi:putative transcriptional regulator